MTETKNPPPSEMEASEEATLENASQPPPKKKRSLPGMPDPEAEVIALSPTTLMATNRFVCEICKKGFQRDQNLQLHRRGHNLPWKLRQRSPNDVRKKVYVCPEPSCVHHHASRALGDLTGIKKHFSRKHGEKKWKCERCSKQYAVQSDWKAHMKSCGTREYRCDCGTFFSRRDSFLTHRAFCDALAEEARAQTLTVASPSPPPPPLTPSTTVISPTLSIQSSEMPENPMRVSPPPPPPPPPKAVTTGNTPSVMASSTISAPSSFSNLMSSISSTIIEPTSLTLSTTSLFGSSLFQDPHYITATTSSPQPPAYSATALLQKAAQMGAASSNASFFHGLGLPTSSSSSSSTPTMTWNTFIHVKQDNLGLGLASGNNNNNNNGVGFADVMMGSSDPFGGPGQPIMTRDLLGLSIGSGVSSLPSFFTSFGGNYQTSEEGGGGIGH